MLGIAKKSPGDVLDYDIDYEQWLVEGDVIVTASATTDAADLVVGDVEVIPPLVKVWLSGGIAGNSYTVTVTATTAEGRVKEVTFTLRVTEC